jgi:hypothetical protein
MIRISKYLPVAVFLIGLCLTFGTASAGYKVPGQPVIGARYLATGKPALNLFLRQPGYPDKVSLAYGSGYVEGTLTNADVTAISLTSATVEKDLVVFGTTTATHLSVKVVITGSVMPGIGVGTYQWTLKKISDGTVLSTSNGAIVGGPTNPIHLQP